MKAATRAKRFPMWEVEANFRVLIGGNTFIDTLNIVAHKGEPIFSLKRRDNDGKLGIYFDIYDAQSDKIATVRNGNIVKGDKINYDIMIRADQYSVHEKSTGRLILDIQHKSEKHEPRSRG